MLIASHLANARQLVRCWSLPSVSSQMQPTWDCRQLWTLKRNDATCQSPQSKPSEMLWRRRGWSSSTRTAAALVCDYENGTRKRLKPLAAPVRSAKPPRRRSGGLPPKMTKPIWTATPIMRRLHADRGDTLIPAGNQRATKRSSDARLDKGHGTKTDEEPAETLRDVIHVTVEVIHSVPFLMIFSVFF